MKSTEIELVSDGGEMSGRGTNEKPARRDIERGVGCDVEDGDEDCMEYSDSAGSNTISSVSESKSDSISEKSSLPAERRRVASLDVLWVVAARCGCSSLSSSTCSSSSSESASSLATISASSSKSRS
jgi:hypothetical protein